MNHHALVLALSIAACSHIVLYALLNLWPAPIPDRVSKSIPVTLVVTPDSKPSSSSKESRTQEDQQKTKNLTTINASNFSVASSEKTDENPTPNLTDQSASDRTQTSVDQQSSRSRAQTSSVRQIFSSDLKDQQQIQAVTTQESRAMSDYEVELLKHLLSSELYDQFHTFMKRQGETQLDFRVRVRLFQNGAIKAASIVEKSKALDIERLAVAAAYNASPYPRPPEEDYDKDFTYYISMSYNESGLH